MIQGSEIFFVLIRFFFFSSFFSFLLVGPASATCLSLQKSAEGYLNDHPVISEEAPYSLQCREAYRHGYSPSYQMHQLLGKVLLKQLHEERVVCRRLLAVKSFFLFDQLYWVSDTEGYKDIKAAVEQILGMPISRVKGRLDFYDGSESRKQYCTELKERVESLQHDGFWLGTEKEINLAPLILEDDKVYRFMKWTKKCKNKKEEAGTQEERFAKVNATSLNMRVNPSRSAAIVRKLPNAELLRLLKRTKEWAEVVDMNCQRGWVAKKYLQQVRSLSKKRRMLNTVLLTAQGKEKMMEPKGMQPPAVQLNIHGLELLSPPPSVTLYRNGYYGIVSSSNRVYRAGYTYRKGYR